MDILERLRDPKPDWVMSSNAKKLLDDADKEIEQLRDALNFISELKVKTGAANAMTLSIAIHTAKTALGK